jgi:hypothetical protein
MLQVRVELDLVDRRRRLGRLEDPVEVLGQVVGDSDGADQACGFDLFHLGPFGLVIFFLSAEEGSVDQVADICEERLSVSGLTRLNLYPDNDGLPDSQINIINPQFLQTGVQRSRDISNIRQHFGHDVEFLARDFGFLNRYA